jgi:hypothetical protein
MGWEKRANQRYFYSKYRIGSRVVSQYLGHGPMAAIAAAELANAKRDRKADRQRERKMRNEENEIDREIYREGKAVDRIVSQFLQVLGYHNHRGTWRRRRGPGRQSGRATQGFESAVGKVGESGKSE